MDFLHFQLEKFQGPLDLLLQLIEEERLCITEISLAKIADQYLDYIAKNPVPPENISEFLVIAAKLLLIKSREILPDLELSQEEEEDIEDFKQRLIDYQKFRRLAAGLRRLERKGEFCREREITLVEQGIFLPPRNVDGSVLAKYYENFLASLPQEIALEQKTLFNKAVSVKEKIRLIKEVLGERVNFSLQSLVKENSREERIITFLALLELLKKGEIIAEQNVAFAEIKFKRGDLSPAPQ